MEEADSLGFDDILPGELVVLIFLFLRGKDLENCLLVNRRWHSILSSEDRIWRQLIRDRQWRGLSREFIATELENSMRQHKWPNARNLYIHLRRTQAVEQRVPLFLQNTQHISSKIREKGLIALTTHNRESEIEDVEYVTKRHVIGFVAYLIPIVGAVFGGRAGAWCTVIGSIIRYFTFQSYYDARRRFPRREAGQACRNCFAWGCVVTAFIRMLVLIHRNRDKFEIDYDSDSSSSIFDSDDSSSSIWSWGASNSNNNDSGFSYRSIGSLPIPSFFK